LYSYCVGQSSEFCRYDPLCCFSTSNTEGKSVFHYRLSPETYGYTLVQLFLNNQTETNRKLRGLET